MKSLLVALVLSPAAAFTSSSSEFIAEFGNVHDAQSVMSKLTGMMGEAQQKLSVAERHHKKVVKKVRKEADAFLQDEAKVYGKYLNDYSAELSKVTDELKGVVATAKAGIAKAEAKPSNPNDWKDPEVEQRAKLGAQVASAERNIKKAERRQTRAVKEAEEQAEENMEDEAQKLGMKLGDMTPLVDKAKKTLEEVAEKPVVAVKAEMKSQSQVNLKALQDNLVKEVSKDQVETTDANKRLDGFLTKTGKDVADKAAKIQKDLDAAQKAEIDEVLGKKQDAKKEKAPVKGDKATKKASVSKAVKAKDASTKTKSTAAKK